MAVKSGALGRDTVDVVYINTMKTTLYFNFDFNQSFKQSLQPNVVDLQWQSIYIDKMKTTFDFNFDLH